MPRVNSTATCVAHEFKASGSHVAKAAIGEFLRRMGINGPPTFSRDLELEARVKAITSTWPFESSIRRHIITATVITETAYAHVPDIEARVAIVLYTALLTSIDSPEIFEAEGAGDFYRKLCNGSLGQENGMMGEFAGIIADMDRFYAPFNASAILSSSLRFLNGERVGTPGTWSFIEPRTKSFVQFQRDMSGDAEAYAAFIWSKADFPDENRYVQVFPDALAYINHVNDILSFYKEDLDGETANYIHARARVTGKSALETLQEVIDEVVAAAERIHDVLGEGPLRDAWDSFKLGYIGFHTGDPRYRLQEVIGTAYMMDTSTF